MSLGLGCVACSTSQPAGTGGAGGETASTHASTTSASTASSSPTTSQSSSSGAGGGGGAPATDPCQGVSDGDHCGSSLGGLADHASLYACQGGMTVSATPCPAGCAADACVTAMADPCASAQSGNGAYCGGSLLGGDPQKLYQCQSGATQSTTSCASGCLVEPPGVPDTCKPTGDPCTNATAGNGTYCGSTISGDPGSLYDCQNKTTSTATPCPNGCTVNPPGTPDACAPSGGTCCLAAPPGVLTQPYSACGNGGSHYGRDYGTAVGTPIYAGIAGTVVGSATGFPNCYSNGCSQSCWNSFNYVKVKSDCGDPKTPGHDLFVYYLHIDSLAPGVTNGTHVSKGQLVAMSGNSGCSSGPHIHIESVSVPQGQSASLSTCNSVDPATRFCN